MSNKVYLIKVILTYFVCMFQEKLVDNLQENTTIKMITNVLPEETMSSTHSFLYGPNVTMLEWEQFSYTEWFLMRRAGREINIKKLMLEYSTICPIQQSCNVHFEEKYLFAEDMYGIPAFFDCTDCECSRRCVEYGNCCPGTYFGYVQHDDCVDTILYPEEESLAYYMVGKCLNTYAENNTIIELCEAKVHPCTSTDSGLIYKNRYCAQCNAEIDCTDWKLNVVCVEDDLFREEFHEFHSLTDMIDALDQSNCKIQYQSPIVTDVGTPCNGRDYLNKVRINRCNVTGLWRQFDSDIDWACENFIVPYKEFRNIFCYICNPSYGSTRTTSLVDTYERHETSARSFNLSNACKDFPASDRLKPFKNIYCYAYSQGHNLLKSTGNDVSYLRDVSETNDPVTLSSQLNLSLVFPYENNVKDVETFLHEIQDTFKVVEINSKPPRVPKTTSFASNMGAIINHYIIVCGQDTLCINDTKTDIVYGNPVCRYCTCKSDCAENEECCLDTILSKQPYSCLKTDIFPVLRKYGTLQNNYEMSINKTFKIIDTCLNKTHEVSYNCSLLDGTTDFFADVPISTYGAVAYRNIYCYACNNNYFKEIILDIQAYCGTYIEHELFTNLSQLLHAVKLHCHSVSFVPVKSKTCVEEYDVMAASYEGGEKYERLTEHPSNFDFKVVEYVNVLARELFDPVKDVYSSCNITGNLKEFNALINETCQNNSLTLLSLPEYRVENKVYKNFACFLCNPEYHALDMDPDEVIYDCRLNSSVEWYERNEALEELCTTTQRYDIWFPYKNMYCAECNLPPWQLIEVLVQPYDVLSPPVYKYLFSLSPEDFEQIDAASKVDNAPKCHNGTYDYNLNQCRQLYCNNGHKLYNSTCKPILETASYHVYKLSLKLLIREDGLPTNSSNSIKMPLEVLCSNITDLITSRFGKTTKFHIQEQQCQASSQCKLPKNAIHSGPLVDISDTEFINLFSAIAIEYTETLTADRKILIDALSRSYNVVDIFYVDGNLHSFVLDAFETPTIEWLDFGQSCTIGNQRIVDTHTPFHYFTVDRFLLCAYVKLNISEVNFAQGALVISIKDTNVTFPESEYKVMDSYVTICSEDYDRRTKKMSNENHVPQSNSVTYLLNIFTLVCTVISLVCLFLTFTTYCLFTTLRTVPGKCMMLLCVSLFCAQSFLQFGTNGVSKSILCVFTGVCIHYFWMAFFCAMNICSFHMFKIFYFSDLSQQVPRKESRLFIKYLLYFIVFPFALVLITVLINVLTSDASFIGYGANYCFISDFYIFLGTFLTPACLIFLSNFIFFSLAFHKIRSSPNVQSNRDKNNFYIFLKLSTIVGVTWPLLIVDNMLDVPWFSFVVSGINSLQGVFIFGSFCLTKRVLLLYKSAFTKTTDEKLFTNTTSTSYSVTNSTRIELSDK